MPAFSKTERIAPRAIKPVPGAAGLINTNPPPYFPDLQNTNNTVILKMASYGEASRTND